MVINLELQFYYYMATADSLFTILNLVYYRGELGSTNIVKCVTAQVHITFHDLSEQGYEN